MKTMYGSYGGTTLESETSVEKRALRTIVEMLKTSGVEFSDTNDCYPMWDEDQGILTFPGE